jgi:hypothetical protein
VLANTLLLIVVTIAYTDSSIESDTSLSGAITQGQISYVGTVMLVIFAFTFTWFALAWVRMHEQLHAGWRWSLNSAAVLLFFGYAGIGVFPITVNYFGHQINVTLAIISKTVFFAIAFAAHCCRGLVLSKVEVGVVVGIVIWGCLFGIAMALNTYWAGRLFHLDMLVLEAVSVTGSWVLLVVLVLRQHRTNILLNRQLLPNSL